MITLSTAPKHNRTPFVSNILCQGFEITVDDISNVLAKFKADSSQENAQRIMDEVLKEKASEIENAALNAEVYDDDEETLNAQTASAYEEIAEILFIADEIKATRCAHSNKLTPDSNLVRVPKTHEWVASENLAAASLAAQAAQSMQTI